MHQNQERFKNSFYSRDNYYLLVQKVWLYGNNIDEKLRKTFHKWLRDLTEK